MSSTFIQKHYCLSFDNTNDKARKTRNEHDLELVVGFLRQMQKSTTIQRMTINLYTHSHYILKCMSPNSLTGIKSPVSVLVRVVG